MEVSVFFLVLNYINVTIVSLLSHRINCWQGVVVVCLCCGFVTMLVTLYLCNIVLMVCSTKVLCPQNLFFFSRKLQIQRSYYVPSCGHTTFVLMTPACTMTIIDKSVIFCSDVPCSLHSAWSESTRATPWPPVPWPQLPTVYCTFCTWAMERYRLCVRISSQKTVNLWTKPYFLTFGSACTKTGGTRAP